MPDFRRQIEESNYNPSFTSNSTTGPNASGEQQTWVNPNRQLEKSSAQELAELMGAKLTEVRYNAGPYSQDKPQYQLDFGPGDDFDASMVYDREQRAPAHFNQNMADEIARSRGPLPPGVQARGEERTFAEMGGKPLDPLAGQPPPPVHPPTPAPPAPPGGGPTWPAENPPNLPGPTWPTPPPPNLPGPAWEPPPPPINTPGPDWTNVPPIPPATGIDPIALHPGTGVAEPGGYNPGGFTPPPGAPPAALPGTSFPAPINLGPPSGGLLNPAAAAEANAGYKYEPKPAPKEGPVGLIQTNLPSALNPMGLLGGDATYQPPARKTPLGNLSDMSERMKGINALAPKPNPQELADAIAEALRSIPGVSLGGKKP